MLRPLVRILFPVFLVVIITFDSPAQNQSDAKIPGTIFLNGETYLHFDDILYIHGFIAPTSRLNRYKAIKIIYNNSIRTISIYTLKYMRIDDYQIGIGQDGTEVIRNSTLRVETKTRESFEMPYFELGWILIKSLDEKTNSIIEQKIPFVKDGKLYIERIILD